MKDRNWSIKLLWFVLGVALASCLTFIATPHQAQSDLEDRVTTLERKVARLQADVAGKQDSPEPTKQGPQPRCWGKECP